MGFAVALDWLSFTLKEHSDENKNLLDKIAPFATRQSIAPKFGYEYGFAYDTGVCAYSIPSRPEMGIHVVVPGTALRMLERSGISSRQLLVLVVSAHAKVTRLDLAKDAYNESINLTKIAQLAIDGKRTGSAQSVSQIVSSGGGQTIYVGSRTSDRFGRLYDKGAQQGTDDDWKRLEIECKGDVAKSLARILADAKTDWNATIGGIMQKMMNVDEESYRRWLDGASVDGLPKIEKQTDREAWLLSQVLPALADHIKKNGITAASEAIYNLLKTEWSK